MPPPLRILVVDDERMYCALLEQTLAAEGYAVDTADNGRQALARFAERDYDIVLTDLQMPDVNGIEVLKAAKARRPATIGIIVTGFASLDTALAAIKDGVYDYITKPFQLEEIKLTVKNAGERLRLETEREDLVQRLEKAYAVIQGLTKNRREYQDKIAEIDQQLLSRQRELTDDMRRLRGFHDRVLPAQFRGAKAAAGKEAAPVEGRSAFEQLNRAVQLRNEGAITEEEFRLLKKKIIGS
jgi:YesN/AraC family two-component response regulator